MLTFTVLTPRRWATPARAGGQGTISGFDVGDFTSMLVILVDYLRVNCLTAIMLQVGEAT